MKILTVGSLPPPIDGQSLAFYTAVKSLRLKYIVRNVQTTFRGKGIASLFFLVLAGGRRGRGEVVDTPEVVRVELLVGFLRYPEAV